MGRHSTGKNNYSLSRGVIALLLVLALLLLAVALWANNRGGDPEAKDGGDECVSGDLELAVTATDLSVAQDLLSAYADSHPVVRDYCVKPVLEQDLTQAAVYIAPDTPISQREIKDAGRSASTSEPPAVAAFPVGVAGRGEAVADETVIESVDFPTGSQPEASALVTTRLSDGDQQAISALADQKIDSSAAVNPADGRLVATAENAAAEGLEFKPMDDTQLVYSAIALNSGDAVTEDQARAGQAFAEFAGGAFDGQPDMPDLADSVWEAALPAGTSRQLALEENTGDNQAADDGEEDVASAAKPMDTLFLLDTSDNMAQYADAAATAIGEAASGVAGADHQVGLWNYSSPLSPGVTRSFRANVALSPDAASVARAAASFTNGGQSNTHEALRAAIDYARSAATPDEPVRVLLVTSGSADGEDENLVGLITDARDNGVYVSVVHLGDGPIDEVFETAASSLEATSNTDDISPAVLAAAGL